jgi:hypothetical protein
MVQRVFRLGSASLLDVPQLAEHWKERSLDVQEVAGQSNGARKVKNIHTSSSMLNLRMKTRRHIFKISHPSFKSFSTISLQIG